MKLELDYTTTAYALSALAHKQRHFRERSEDTTVTPGGRESFRQLADAYGDAYDKVKAAWNEAETADST